MFANTLLFLTDADGKRYGTISTHKANMAIQYHRFDNAPVYDPQPTNIPDTYAVSTRNTTPRKSIGLIDGGANGGIGSDRDMRLLEFDPENRRVNVSGVGNHLVNDKRIETFLCCNHFSAGTCTPHISSMCLCTRANTIHPL